MSKPFILKKGKYLFQGSIFRHKKTKNMLQRRLSCLQTFPHATWRSNAKHHARALFFAACKHFTRLDAAVAETKHGFNNQAFKPFCSNCVCMNPTHSETLFAPFAIPSPSISFRGDVSYKVILSGWTSYLPWKLTHPSGHLKRKVVFQLPCLKETCYFSWGVRLVEICKLTSSIGTYGPLSIYEIPRWFL